MKVIYEFILQFVLQLLENTLILTWKSLLARYHQGYGY